MISDQIKELELEINCRKDDLISQYNSGLGIQDLLVKSQELDGLIVRHMKLRFERCEDAL
jgi:hypothetical protein